MYLVEFIQIIKKDKIEQCSGFYSLLDAYDFALKLNQCANIKSIMVSEIDTSYANVLYNNDCVESMPDNESKFREKFEVINATK